MRFKEVGSRLKKIREHLGLTQKEFALHIGASYRGWQANESGTMPGGDLLLKLSGIGVNINWVLTGEGETWLAGSTQTPGSDSLPMIQLALLDEITQQFRAPDSEFRGIPLEHLMQNLVAIYNSAIDVDKSRRTPFIRLQVNLYNQQSCNQQLVKTDASDWSSITSLETKLENLKTEETNLRSLITRSL
ncbi:MAG: helix-turn-helix domain-containing protein [Gammaproteobacteria bacterium]|nr:helix-turn-helix domain-containing protein [Gammaproteobacteria bacterium]